jgi:hypothetical protein
LVKVTVSSLRVTPSQTSLRWCMTGDPRGRRAMPSARKSRVRTTGPLHLDSAHTRSMVSTIVSGGYCYSGVICRRQKVGPWYCIFSARCCLG